MKLNFYTIGKSKIPEYSSLVDHYLGLTVKKQGRLRLNTITIPDKNSEGQLNPHDLLVKYKLRSKQTWFLAEWGKQLTTSELIKCLNDAYQNSETVNFVIGNAWGWLKDTDPGIQYLSLSSMVFSHELAYVMLAEQVYRFADYLAGGRYTK